ncbi:mediator of RNA polymerase II transcription subunit 8 isoform X1 [Mirounga leonina]|uniref:mediator of RNA polymerase II transcription subunit 8 isoform X1 n=1 Tax=Mirounga leonina TaxID=9715 RepID=UPI00156C0A4D|nr:mediator of RNA polymerase II transcription subunit 8 isoform X1 [Mirounga leonina]
MRQTEGRVPVFSHEVVPDHLRTKPDPEVEEQEKQLTTDAARVGADAAQKQIQSLNKMCSNLLEKISKEERESESGGLRPNKQTFNPADTNALVAAVAFGKGLSNWRPSGSSGPGQPGQPGAGTILAGASGLQQVQMAGAPSQQQPLLSGVQMAQTGQTGKMPSGIKTNIKSASMHPYQRYHRSELVLASLHTHHQSHRPCCVTATPLFLPLSCKYSQLELGPGSEVLCHTSTARRGSALYLDRLPSLFPAASPLVYPSSVTPIRSLPPPSLYTRPFFNYT